MPGEPPDRPAIRSARRGWSWRPSLRWFAAEIAVIVAGVLIALTLDSWWQGRQDAASERSYLVLVGRDLDQMEADLEELVEFESQMVEHGLRAYRILSAKVASDEARAQVSESLAQLLNRRTMSVTDATYRDLLSTGGLRLVRDRELRDRLVGFYEEAERSFDIHDKNNAVFVDGLFVHELLGRGLLYSRGGAIIASRSRTDSILRAEFAGGYVDGADPLWSLPESAAEWDTVRSVLLQRVRTAAYARTFAEEQLESVRELQGAVAAALGKG